MMQGDEMEGMDNSQEEGGEISVSLGKAAKPGDSVSGTWSGTVKSNDGGQAVVALSNVSADVNQADESLAGMMGGGDQGGEVA